MDDRRYPVGPFERQERLSREEVAAAILVLESAPVAVRDAVGGLSEEQLDTPYREGGWTVRQVVHHLPDSHLNAYLRMKLAATEDEPEVRLYDEKKFALLFDARLAEVEPSLRLLEGLHARWTNWLRSLDRESLERRFRHPELGAMSIATALALYAWHSRHHVAHVTSLRARSGW